MTEATYVVRFYKYAGWHRSIEADGTEFTAIAGPRDGSPIFAGPADDRCAFCRFREADYFHSQAAHDAEVAEAPAVEP